MKKSMSVTMLFSSSSLPLISTISTCSRWVVCGGRGRALSLRRSEPWMWVLISQRRRTILSWRVKFQQESTQKIGYFLSELSQSLVLVRNLPSQSQLPNLAFILITILFSDSLSKEQLLQGMFNSLWMKNPWIVIVQTALIELMATLSTCSRILCACWYFVTFSNKVGYTKSLHSPCASRSPPNTPSRLVNSDRADSCLLNMLKLKAAVSALSGLWVLSRRGYFLIFWAVLSVILLPATGALPVRTS